MLSDIFDARVLIVDDEIANVRLLEIILQQAGYTNISGTTDSRRVCSLFDSLRPDVLLLDLMMPYMDGFEIMRAVLSTVPSGSYLPVLVMTADTTRAVRMKALAGGAKDFLTKPFDDTEVVLRLKNLLEVRLQNSLLEEGVRKRTADLAASNAILEAQITKRKRTEVELIAAREAAEQAREELERSNQQLSESFLRANELADIAERASVAKGVLLKAIPSILIGTDQHGTITQWNPIAEQIFAIPSQEAVGKPFVESGIRWDWLSVSKSLAANGGGNRPFRLDDIPFTYPNGGKGFLGISISPLTEGNGFSGFLLLGADVTRRKLLESQLVQAQKLESIGHLAAGIAHEINTPIQYVGDNTQFIQKSFRTLQKVLEAYEGLASHEKESNLSTEHIADREATIKSAKLPYLMAEVPVAIQESLEGIARVAEIVRAMKDFSHPGTGDKVMIDLNRSIKSAVTVSSNEWKYLAAMKLDLAPELPHIPCLPSAISQVILNIIINAAHAIACVVGDGSVQKGVIGISTHLDGNWVEIRVQDTGMGIAEADRSKVFDLFFTTKEVGKGTGQGLALAHTTIVEKHGGSIHFESEVGKGTTFILRLPIEELSSEPIQTA